MKLTHFIPVVMMGTILMTTVHADDNVHFSGALVAEPCTLPESETDIKLDFGSVIEKSLYQYQRTKSIPFAIHLVDCDPTLMSTVSATFEGTADDELSGMLELDPSSSAKGVAIGLERLDGSPLAINKAGAYQQLSQGNNSLTFNAYIQAKPGAIAQKQITAGEFTATSTFVLTYQ